MTLKDLQLRLIKQGLDAYIVTRNNMFIGQDILEEENQLRNLSGFTGSNGVLLVCPNKAFLIVDGRYDIQARQETNPEQVEVLVGKVRGMLNKTLKKEFSKKSKVGFNPWCHSIHEIELITDSNPHISFVESELLPTALSHKKPLVFEHTIEFAGLSREEKTSQFAEGIKQNGFDAFFVSAADSVSWLLNIRSDCLKNSPIVRAFAIISAEGKVTVFADNIEFASSFETKTLSEIEKELAKYKKKKLGFCYYQTPHKIKNIADKNKIIHSSFPDLTQNAKAQKNPTELANIKKAHLRDGIVLSKFIFWLENNYQGLTELDVVEKLYEFREIQQNFFSNSFDTIAGFGSNSAIVHYNPNAESNKNLTEGVLLLDSGAQYLDGTTDATRTIYFGTPKQDIKNDFTTVLKAHISLASATIRMQTSGMDVDILARSELWKKHKDYDHGTGHGVGYFLNVHEGPNSISPNGTKFSLYPDMITSIEPGFYKEGEYGIRIENIYHIFDDGGYFLGFEPLTLAPIDKKLINTLLLNDDEINWLNAYHKKVFEKLEPYMEGTEKLWLIEACAPL